MSYAQLGTLFFIVFILSCMILTTRTQVCIFLFSCLMVHFYFQRNQKAHFTFFQSNFFVAFRLHIQLINQKSIQLFTYFFIVLSIFFFKITHLKILHSLQFSCIQQCSRPLARSDF